MKKQQTRIFAFFLILAAMCSTYTLAAEVAETSSTTPTTKNNEKWWSDRHEAKLAEVKSKAGNVDLLWIGDSITHGWEGGGQAVWNKFYANRKPLNIGYSADRTENVLWRLNNGEVDGISPKLVVMMIGTNNIGFSPVTPAETVEGVKAILDNLEKKLPETKVLLLAVFPRGADENDGLRKAVNEINQGLPALADGKRVFFLDIGPKFLDENKVLSQTIMPDLLHPNEQGYQIWAEAIEPSVKKLLDEK